LRLRIYLLLAATMLYVSATALYHALSTELIRDEHQFLAGAYLIGEQGLRPYRDFPYFHMPNLSYLQAAFFQTLDHPLLGARLFSAASAVALVVGLFLAANALAPRKQDESWVIISLSSALLFANSKLFADAAGFAWNHAPAALASLLAFLLHRRALRRSLPARLAAASGFLLGLAIGFRLSSFPLIFPFLAALLLAPRVDFRIRLRAVLAFGLGGLLANAPALSALASSRDAFIFGNLGYPRLNTLYRQEEGFQIGMTLAGKLELAATQVLRQLPELLLLATVVFSITAERPRRWLQLATSRPDSLLLLSVIPFALIGALAPTPSFPQYFIGPAVFGVLLAPYGLAYLRPPEARRSGAWLLASSALLSTLYGGIPKSTTSLGLLVRPGLWAPMQLHVQASQIAQRLADQGVNGQVLTLAPTYVIEAGLPIIPEFASGPFAWRVGHLMSPADRRRYRVVAPADLEEFLSAVRPEAMLTGPPHVGHLEGPLSDAAQQLGYWREELSDILVLWIR
jgi:4-amino-4-deoxy-L-arabinose transferase-like glycosyltransferase